MDDREFSFYLSQNDRENYWINHLIVIFCLCWSIIIEIEKGIASSKRIWFRCQKFSHCDTQRKGRVNIYRWHWSRRWPVNLRNNWEKLELMSQFCGRFPQNGSEGVDETRANLTNVCDCIRWISQWDGMMRPSREE
jgi:hypothetical protein